MIKTYFRLFTHCILVKGYRKSSISDIQRKALTIIPNDLYDIIQECENYAIEEIKESYGEDNTRTLNGYFDFLIQNEYGYYTSDSKNVIKFSKKHETPERISNAIIDLGLNSSIPWDKVLSELHDLGCKHIQLRAYVSIKLEELESIMAVFPRYRFKSIDLITKNNAHFSDKDWISFYNKNPYITQLTIHSAEKNEAIGNSLRILKTKQKILSCNACGVISQNNFSYNLKSYLEGLSFNSCLNKKISVDEYGYIKNCPSMENDYGHIDDTSLHEAIVQKHFEKYWHLNKDKIKICKDCEFRRVCTDCRAYLEDPKDINSKPLKCGYNPYTAEWEDWSATSSKKEAIGFYQLSEICT